MTPPRERADNERRFPPSVIEAVPVIQATQPGVLSPREWLTLDYMVSTFGWALLALACLITLFGIAAAFEYHHLVSSIPSALKPERPA